MSLKLCQVIFSTNRIEYLCKTLEAQQYLDFSGFEVDKIFIDDMPHNRNNDMIRALVNGYGFKEIYLHHENLGLSLTWTKFWRLINSRNYNFVWHQEDDVEILQPIKVMELAEILAKDRSLSQIVLKRQPWYPNETESKAEDTDILFNDYRYEKNSMIFSPMASLYAVDVVRFGYSRWFKFNHPDSNLDKINLNEGMIGLALHEAHGLLSGHLKNKEGKNLIRHIGEYFTGKRVLPGEPNYEIFAHYDPFKKYYSTDGRPFE